VTGHVVRAQDTETQTFMTVGSHAGRRKSFKREGTPSISRELAGLGGHSKEDSLLLEVGSEKGFVCGGTSRKMPK